MPLEATSPIWRSVYHCFQYLQLPGSIGLLPCSPCLVPFPAGQSIEYEGEEIGHLVHTRLGGGASFTKLVYEKSMSDTEAVSVCSFSYQGIFRLSRLFSSVSEVRVMNSYLVRPSATINTLPQVFAPLQSWYLGIALPRHLCEVGFSATISLDPEVHT